MTECKLSFKEWYLQWQKRNPGKLLLFPNEKSTSDRTCVSCGDVNSVHVDENAWKLLLCEGCGLQTAGSLYRNLPSRRRFNGLGPNVPF